MQQLDSTETSYIELDAPGKPQHISAILLYDQAELAHKPFQYREVLDAFARNLHKSACFHRRLQRVPLDLDYPYWVADDNFDLDYHVRHIALPQPGDWSQLRRIAAKLHATPLDMSRPLWEAYVVDGTQQLSGSKPDAFAILLKIHYSALRNDSWAALIGSLHQDAPDRSAKRQSSQHQQERVPTKLQMLAGAYFRHVRHPSGLLEHARRRYPEHFARFQYGVRRPRQGEAQDRKKPATRFNEPISGERVIGLLQIPEQVLRDISAAIDGITPRDALVSIIGGALRQYLLEKNELPEVSLTLQMGASGQKPRPGIENRDNTPLSLETHLSDPLVRLRTIAAAGAGYSTRTIDDSEPAATTFWTAPIDSSARTQPDESVFGMQQTDIRSARPKPTPSFGRSRSPRMDRTSPFLTTRASSRYMNSIEHPASYILKTNSRRS